MLKIEKIQGVKVLCVGDIMLDRYFHSSVSRISPEGPVPVARVVRKEDVAGGVGNVARNIATLGAHVTVCAVIGDDAAGKDLEQLLTREARIKTCFIVAEGHPTTEKVRFVSQGQQLLRADQEDATPIRTGLEEKLLGMLEQEINQHHVLVISDYAKGALTKNVLEKAISIANQHHIPVIVDPKSSDLSRYAGATVITPNAKEIWDATEIKVSSNEEAEKAGLKALQTSRAKALLITRAEQGMSLIQMGKEAVHIRASAREVFDVVGAGDTVVATLAVFLGTGRSLEEASKLANMAAGVVVGKAGTATVSIYELMEAIKQEEMSHDPQSSIKNKITSKEEIKQQCLQWKAQGLKVGFTNGCFDLLHVGHVSLLTFSRAQCDRLIIGLNSDLSVKRLKGESRPINNEQDRSYVLAALQSIDAVVVFEDDTPQNLIEMLTPDVLIKGADYSIDQIVGAKHVLEHGGSVRTFELVPGKSSTKMIEKARLTE
ncbi:MAG: bifunctional D-glycero-beta-D-manno-heptose-7-phosphate kinase/D-glycero-beta-D-manno-heptose 1-phosphate adenylyltransferase HldE [Saezia sp.]